jgi:hypothetical protein
MNEFINIENIGTLYFNENILNWRTPILFTCKDTSANIYLVYCSDEEEQTYTVVKSEEKSIDNVKSGKIAPYDVFAQCADKMAYFVRLKDNVIQKLNVADLTADMLPYEQEYI